MIKLFKDVDHRHYYYQGYALMTRKKIQNDPVVKILKRLDEVSVSIPKER